MAQCVVNKRIRSLTGELILEASREIQNYRKNKVNIAWIEATGCSGNIISFLNADAPNLNYFLTQVANLRYTNSLMLAQGEQALIGFNELLKENFILIVDGSISVKDNGVYTYTGNFNGRLITSMEEVASAAQKASYILAVGTCASFGGISAAAPNTSGSISLQQYLKGKRVINLPGCPCHPDWVMGTIANLILYGEPELDDFNRPKMFYGNTIHDYCERRSFFENKIFAESVGQLGCMFKLGCRGPVTRTDCPTRNWNDRVNWPVGDNTPCIGCAQYGFPDLMEPFVKME
ncbi:hydrogenase small subunit [Clostridium sp.]|uniref:hydrogenase small subunit n=1 Tax=Clostridium sp. TaxID=1506 RepID=UPI002FC95819